MKYNKQRNEKATKWLGILLFLTCWLGTPAIGLAHNPLETPDPDYIEYPDDDPPPETWVQLGKTLFFDPRLSRNDTQSCATCHNPDLGFGDGLTFSRGANGQTLTRHTPHLYNLAWSVIFLWDGRANSLEEQALEPIASEEEMNLPIDELVNKLQEVPQYRQMFEEAFPESGINRETIAAALAAFERTIQSVNAPFDQYIQGNTSAMSAEAIRGLELFKGKARCVLCHDGANFTDDGFHNIGIGDADLGRWNIQEAATSKGAFKTPGLRNTTLTAPYMHDGSIPTLEAVLQHYNKGGNPVEGLDSLIKPLGLNDQEISDLIAFLGALTDPVTVIRPLIP